MHGVCRLCDQQADLQESHIIPAFVARWFKETSATGYFRIGRTPNLRAQDGVKKHLLCSSCEGLFSGWETRFASDLFYPMNEDMSLQVRYGDWLLKFCVSISWRVLTYIRETSSRAAHFTPEVQAMETATLDVWKKFILGQIDHPAGYEQHIIPLEPIAEAIMPNMPSNINRYFLRAVDMDVGLGDATSFVYSKVGRFIILGFLKLSYPQQWVGTKVHVRKGLIGGRSRYIMPMNFGEYLMDRATKVAGIHDQISEKQQGKISESISKNIDRFGQSETFKAMHHDALLFGTEAVFANKSKK